MKHNSIRVIVPYQWNGLWVFDDEATGLQREAFVAGADEFISKLAQPIPDSAKGFLLLFSDQPFKGHTIELEWTEGDADNLGTQTHIGNTYRCKETGAEGWFCPALFCYFDKAPPRLYAQAKSISSRLPRLD